MKRLTFKFVKDTQKHSGILALDASKSGKRHSQYRQILNDSAGRNGRCLNHILLTARDSKKTSHSKQFQNTGGHTSSLAGTGDTCIQHFSQLGAPRKHLIAIIPKYRQAHFITTRNGRHLYPALLTGGNSRN
ncbi:hypothetical protein TNCV_516491 [Trichonephila clavipes]|nr:hypothetical protein TNCV_516491 [Trichonephila clavipes]